MRGDGAPGGAAVVGSRSAPPCEDAEAPPGAPPGHLSTSRVICGRLTSASPTVVNGMAAPGRAFEGAPLLLLARTTRRSVSQLLAGGSYWPPGGAPAPPGCLGGAFVSRPRAPHPAPSSDASR